MIFGTVANQRVLDKEVLDQWDIPFGLWIEEIVFWLTNTIGGFLDAVKWPVDQMLKLVIDNLLQEWLPWPLVLLLFFLLGAATRNFLVGLGSAVALLICGLLGPAYWDLTMETLGMIIVAVLICAVIGMPLGILSARQDAFWNRLRPILDGMQVIHPFVYLLPIIFLFGLRRTPGVLATLVFALPPIVRLTNLGIRQVPSDVVESARAFGATEWRVLKEVQLPLARPAIMAGLNQTLLLSLSMVGIVAIIAGGGLGKPVLTALSTSDTPTGASAGAGLYFVGVLLDRLSQPQSSDPKGSLFKRMAGAWTNRTEPEVPPLPNPAAAKTATTGATSTSEATSNAASNGQAQSADARLPSVLALIGGIVAIVSVFLPWAHDGARVSAYFRFDDTDLPGAHNGFAATGGSWFGGLVAIVAGMVVLHAAVSIWNKSPLRLSLSAPALRISAGVVMASLALAYFSIAVKGEAHRNGFGVWLAVIGASIVIGAGLWGYLQGGVGTISERPSPYQLVSLAVLALFLAFAGASGSWILDQRSDAAAIAAELAAQVEEGAANQGGVAADILAQAMAETRRVTVRGLEADGPLIGYSILALTALATLAGLARRVSSGKIRQLLGVGVLAFGSAIIAVSLAWIASLVRLSANQIFPGASAFLSACGGALLVSIGWRATRPSKEKAKRAAVSQGEATPSDIAETPTAPEPLLEKI